MNTQAARRLIIALDYDRLLPALRLARQLARMAGMFKIGSQLFTAEGPEAVKAISKTGAGVFLDLKFHDIPNTVAGAVAAASGLPGVRLVNVHTLGGAEMMRAAVRALAGRKRGERTRPRLLGVTVLTSLDGPALRRMGILGTPETRAVKLAQLAAASGLDGVVASPREIGAIRRACGRDFLVVVPGVRPRRGSWAGGQDDQARISTPAEAIRAGADYIVVGRPITRAINPVAATEAIVQEITEGLRSRI